MNRFKKDAKRQKKRGKDMRLLSLATRSLADGEELAASYKDHALIGNWEGWRDCHLEPDWLLIYRISDEALILARTGSHSDIF
ncbi:type II toxin-antitoxin system YafQ family toxin [Verrucomicrobiales bacterium]|nr:type II toxin-antitoxin system YafQ family toxin [Verrucomicrobiales bacterium]